MSNFKKTILFGGAALCLYPSLLWAETCGTTPSCSSLGFTVPAASLSTSCKDKSYLKCPFGDYYFCSVSTASTTCSVANCAKCKDGSTTICETCEDGYYGYPLSKDGNHTFTSCKKLITVTCAVLNCAECSDTNTVCKTCKSGYTLSSDKTSCTKASSCNGVELTCINQTYCCPSSSGITSCSQINSDSSNLNPTTKCLTMTLAQLKFCEEKSITCNGASYCCDSSFATCSNKSGCTLQ